MPEDDFKPKKVFTLKEANGALPLVSRIAQDIVRVHEEMLQADSQARALAEDGRSVKAKEIVDRLHELDGQIVEYVGELDEIGCILKDPAIGLVDFPARAGSRVVFLCWRLGESEVRFWHEAKAGFGGRQPVAGTFL